MKKIALLLSIALTAWIISCSDDNNVSENQSRLGFRFTADSSSLYNFAIRFDTTTVYDSAFGTSFMSEYSVSNLFDPPADTLRFTVYPPFEWVGTDANADVRLQILYNGQIIADTTGQLTGFDRPGGITVSSVF